jgi:hypothetical protein
MVRRITISCCWLPALLAVLTLTVSLAAQGLPPAGPGGPYQAMPGPQAAPAPVVPQPAYRIAERTPLLAPDASPAQLHAGNPNEHPLMPALRWARAGLGNIEKIDDYSATMIKRERVGNHLNDYEYVFAKIRHRPFSVYLSFLGPAALKGQEVLYIAGANNGRMWAHGVGIQETMFGTVSLKPDGALAMRGQRYPLTEIGLLNLTKRLAEVAGEDVKYGECEVKFFKGAKINNRVCTCVQVIHPVPRRNFLFHIARIFVDDELNMPIRYEAYDWPKTAGGAPELIEEYTYLNLKLNNGFTDADFDIHNPHYHFH